jgi:hypothetical protein
MMTGATKNSPITFRGLQSARTSESPLELQEGGGAFEGLKEFADRERLSIFDTDDISGMFDSSDAAGRMCTCPVCKSEQLITLSELGKTPSFEDEDGYVVPDVKIGATGIVIPGRAQLVRWFKVPVVPKMSKSKLHEKAKVEGKHHSMFTFLSAFSFQTVFFTPCPSTILSSILAAGGAGYRTYKSLKKAALTEDQAIGLELKVRVHAYKARNTAWDRLFYCAGCGMVHDREGKKSLPWYAMLQLVHYPEQEFEVIASKTPERQGQLEPSMTAPAYQAA